jgi:hypothetical protein
MKQYEIQQIQKSALVRKIKSMTTENTVLQKTDHQCISPHALHISLAAQAALT